jgi:hypothetical protein
MVPQKMAKAAPTRIKLLNRKVLSRERRESSSFSPLSRLHRLSKRVKEKITINPMKVRNRVPSRGETAKL